MRPPRLLVAAPTHEADRRAVGPWLRSLNLQHTALLMDVLFVDGTPEPSDDYLGEMRELARMTVVPRIRLKRFGMQADGRAFTDEAGARLYAHSVIFDAFTRSLSYDHLLCLDLTVPLQSSYGIAALGYVAAPWASLDVPAARDRALAASLLDGEMVRAVPFVHNTLGSDAGYERACAESGYPPRVFVGSCADLGLAG